MPWSLILKHAPAILAAANSLYSRTTSSPGRTKPGNDPIAALEEQSRESARLLQDIAQQLQALTLAQEVAARRARLALIVGSVALIVAAFAAVLAVMR